MSLRWYRWPRVVMLSSTANALDAARALENNQIGAVIVQDYGRAIGIVTDRDLAVRVVGRGRDARSTPLADVMTPGVATLPVEATRDDALWLMQERGVRRIPIVEEDRIVGLVTLDDLLLDEAAPIEEVAEVVRAQIGVGGPAVPRRPTERAEHRRAARAESTYGRFLHALQGRARLETEEQAETVLEVVLRALARRLTPNEAEDLIAQLPSLMQGSLRALEPGPDRAITRESIEADLVRRLDVDPARAAELVNAVGVILEEHVSAGQIDDVRAQLPAEMRSIFR